MSLVGVDWGTTRLRAYRIGPGGAVEARREAELGLQAVREGDFEGALRSVLGEWQDGSPLLLCGMVGSRQGWREAPYLGLPARAEQAAAALTPLELRGGGRAWLVPGLRCGVAERIRGEETQLWGACAPGESARCCLPGTHSKWVEVEDGAPRSFRTFLTGELFDLLSARSILSRTLVRGEHDAEAFARGVAETESGGLLGRLFAVRGLGLAGELSPPAQASYLSGLLIGAELSEAGPVPGSEVTLVGAGSLVARYQQALALRGVGCRALDGAEAAARGLWRVARAAGLIGAET